MEGQYIPMSLLQRVRLLSTLAAGICFRQWPPPVGVAYRLQFFACEAAEDDPLVAD